MTPLRQREKYQVLAGMIIAGLGSYADGSMEWSMWWLVNALGILWVE